MRHLMINQVTNGLNSIVLGAWSIWSHCSLCVLYGILLNLAGVLSLSRQELHCGGLAGFKVFLISLHLHQMVANFLLGRSHVLILVIGMLVLCEF